MGCALSVRRNCNLTRAVCIPGMRCVCPVGDVAVCVCVFFFIISIVCVPCVFCFLQLVFPGSATRVTPTKFSASRGIFRLVTWPPRPARAPRSATPSPLHSVSSPLPLILCSSQTESACRPKPSKSPPCGATSRRMWRSCRVSCPSSPPTRPPRKLAFTAKARPSRRQAPGNGGRGENLYAASGTVRRSLLLCGLCDDPLQCCVLLSVWCGGC